ncbi:MAG: hypothetical protein J5858_10645 [Lentisphaeria bacterium]|nr:hypothetical protein [Lentisphaeria bacterium]
MNKKTPEKDCCGSFAGVKTLNISPPRQSVPHQTRMADPVLRTLSPSDVLFLPGWCRRIPR